MNPKVAHDPPQAAAQVVGSVLYVVATPIGNLADISLRALEILRSAGAVAAEDTRVTRRLLDHYAISTRLISVHEHNELRAARDVLDLLGAGAAVALVSDAGTPGISDPGARLVGQARAAGYAVVPVPGANAAVAAMSASGFLAPHFLFYGFLPARSAARRAALAQLAPLPYTLVFHEAPHRVAACVDDLALVLGETRQVLIARELTKLFEQTHCCALHEAKAWLAADAYRSKGEFVLVVEGAAAYAPAASDLDKTLRVMLEELPLKQAVGLAVKLTGAGRNEVYARALEMKQGVKA